MKAMIDFDTAPVFGIPLVDGTGLREGMLIEGPQGWGEFSPPQECDGRELARWLTAAIEGGTVGWPDPRRGRIPIAVGVPAVEPAVAGDVAATSGCRTADVSVGGPGGSLDDDVSRVAAGRAALGPPGRIRLSAKGRSWIPVDGFLPVAPMPASPDVTLLARYALPDLDRVAWWRDRLRSARVSA